MNCEQCRELLVGYLYEELDDRQRKELESVLRDCPECQAELQELMVTVQVYRQLPDVEVPARVHQNILREARLHADVLKAASRPWYAGWLIPGLSLGAAAASILLGLRIFGAAQAPSLNVPPADESPVDSRSSMAAAEDSEPTQASSEQMPNPDPAQAPAASSREGNRAQQRDEMAELSPAEEAQESQTLLDQEPVMDNVSPPARELRQRVAGNESATRADSVSGQGGPEVRGLGGLDDRSAERSEEPRWGRAGGTDSSSGAAPSVSGGVAAAPASREPSPMPAPAPAPTPLPRPAAAPNAMAAGASPDTAAPRPSSTGMASPSAPSAMPAPGQPAAAYGEQEQSRSAGVSGASGVGMSPFSDTPVQTAATPDADEIANRRERERRERPNRPGDAAQASSTSPTEDTVPSSAQNLDSIVSGTASAAAGEREQAAAGPQPADLPSLIALVERGQHGSTLDDFQLLVATQPSAFAYYWYVQAALGAGQRSLAQRLLDVMRRDYPTDELTQRAELLVVPPPASASPASDE